MPTRYLRVRNFEKFQHYKINADSFPWIKLYYALMRDYRFYKLPDATKWHVCGFFLLASQHKNKIPHDMEWIRGEINATDKINLEVILASKFVEWVEPDGPIARSVKEITDKTKEELAPIFVDQSALEQTHPSALESVDKKRIEKKREENTLSAAPPNEVLPEPGFEELWEQYPSRDGRKDAEKHYKASVKTAQNHADIITALANYKNHLARNDWKRPMGGKTWFNNWRDWVNWEETEAKHDDWEAVQAERERIFGKKP